jgi:hypothetical protein
MAVLISEWPRPANTKPEDTPYVEGSILFVSPRFFEIALDPASLAKNSICLDRCR